jgi:hypothetical protein
MAIEQAQKSLGSTESRSTATKFPEPSRHHILHRKQQQSSGRLYCNEDVDLEIPSLEIYAAR